MESLPEQVKPGLRRGNTEAMALREDVQTDRPQSTSHPAHAPRQCLGCSSESSGRPLQKSIVKRWDPCSVLPC